MADVFNSTIQTVGSKHKHKFGLIRTRVSKDWEQNQRSGFEARLGFEQIKLSGYESWVLAKYVEQTK